MTNYFSSSPGKGLITLKNTKSYKLKFAHRFLQSLIKIKRTHHHDMNVSSSSSSSSSSDVDQILKRSRRIKLAAYSSMAHAIGPRKAWARALLFKLRNRKKPISLVVRKRSSLGLKKKKRVVNSTYKPEIVVIKEKTERLREVVPGGKDMDVSSLFEETAHFIKCLTFQVQIMKDIADQLSKP